MQPVFTAGSWSTADSTTPSFHAWNPSTGEPLDERYPISTSDELDRIATAALDASAALSSVGPTEFNAFLRRVADHLDAEREPIARMAHLETGLPLTPRLAEVEFDRMVGQLRQAAAAAVDVGRTSWRRPIVDEATGIRSDRGPLGAAVLTIGPNNFPLAFHAVAGGDFAAAIAAGNPVIAKGHPLHPGTGLLLAQCVGTALAESDLPAATVQYFHHCTEADGFDLVRHPGVAAVGFTGGRTAGLGIKRVADEVGTPAYLEMSSVNPVFASIDADPSEVEALAEAWVGSITLGGGQFCTKPGMLVVVGEQAAEDLAATVESKLGAAAPGLLFSERGQSEFVAGIEAFESAGARRRCGGRGVGPGWRAEPTLLEVDHETATRRWSTLSQEIFGPVGVLVRVDSMAAAIDVARSLEGQLTATVWGSSGVAVDWGPLVNVLRPRCGRLLERKMPTGVAVVPSMVHGGPYPSTGHAGFTSVGLPASIERFSVPRCWDGVSEALLPTWLR